MKSLASINNGKEFSLWISVVWFCIDVLPAKAIGFFSCNKVASRQVGLCISLKNNSFNGL